jgi:very-short-patch-repair endonuclease
VPIKNIIPGQKINPEKLHRARELRHEMTPAEKMLWQALRGNKLGGLHFRRQQIIAGFIVNFYCHAAGLVIEIEGEIHQQQQEYDAKRDKVLSEIGLRVLHISNEEVLEDLSQVLTKILAVCEQTKQKRSG